MTTWKVPFAAVTAFAVLALLAQDPERPPRPDRPTPPPGAGSPPPVDEPYVSPVLRHDLLQQFEPPHPIEGFYELRERVVEGRPVPKRSKGYLVVGHRHVSLHLQSETDDPDVPLLRAGFRRYRMLGDELHMTSLIGHYNNLDGDVSVEAEGLTISRRYTLAGSSLRIWQDTSSYLEFTRIE